MKIALGADHRGRQAAHLLAEKLRREGHEVTIHRDPGNGMNAPVCDYPEPAFAVAQAIARGQAETGILLCGTGIGMSIAANKVKGARAAVVHDEFTAQLSRTHNNANILCLSADLLGQRLIEQIAGVFLGSSFEGGRHQRRIAKIELIEAGRDPGEHGGGGGAA
jgi:ribose 5-phosphate isomerase B